MPEKARKGYIMQESKKLQGNSIKRKENARK
jgi:hypothetical protein